MNRSEIRESQIRQLLEKVRKRNYGSYLRSIFLQQIRQFRGASITFDFPVTALIGPNGSGKSTVLGAAAGPYSLGVLKQFFFTSIIGDQSTFKWELEYELIEREISPNDAVRVRVEINKDGVSRDINSQRQVHYFGIHRTVPPVNSPLFMRKHLAGKGNSARRLSEIDIRFVREEASKVLGKDLTEFKLLDVVFTKIRKKRAKGPKSARKELWRLLNKSIHSGDFVSAFEEIQTLAAAEQLQRSAVPEYVDHILRSSQQLFVFEGQEKFSEFNFGSGEASVLRLIHQIELLPEQSLILIEEIENGLHPLAVERLIDYLIAAAERRKIQVVFTTHSEYAVQSLPPEGVWAIMNGRAIQGKLSIESLRAISGRVDKRLAIFTEDFFSVRWLEAILREGLGEKFDEVGIYQLGGDSEAVRIHLAHNQNPSIGFQSLCFLDGDSQQKDNAGQGIHRLPGQSPELSVFETVRNTLPKNAALLTAACQRPLSCQQLVIDAVQSVANTNRDPHLLFSQVGSLIGLVSEEVVRGAFFSVWIQEHAEDVKRVSAIVSEKLKS